MRRANERKRSREISLLDWFNSTRRPIKATASLSSSNEHGHLQCQRVKGCCVSKTQGRNELFNSPLRVPFPTKFEVRRSKLGVPGHIYPEIKRSTVKLLFWLSSWRFKYLWLVTCEKARIKIPRSEWQRREPKRSFKKQLHSLQVRASFERY